MISDINRRPAAPAPSGATRKPYYLHWFHADPFARVVVLVVGDYKASFKEINRKFKIKPNIPKLTVFRSPTASPRFLKKIRRRATLNVADAPCKRMDWTCSCGSRHSQRPERSRTN